MFHTHINVIKCLCLIRNVFAFGVQFTCDSDAFYICLAWPLRIRLPFLGIPPGNGKKPEDGEGAIGDNFLVGWSPWVTKYQQLTTFLKGVLMKRWNIFCLIPEIFWSCKDCWDSCGLGKWQNRYAFQIVGLMNRYCRTGTHCIPLSSIAKFEEWME